MFALIASLLLACGGGPNASTDPQNTPAEESPKEVFSANQQLATFAGGCFWCVEAPFEDLDGVISVVSGYAGGKEKNPTYGEVAGGKTSHRESVQITFDPEVISYAELVDIFWQTYDPTDVGGSFFDRGTQSRAQTCIVSALLYCLTSTFSCLCGICHLCFFLKVA